MITYGNNVFAIKDQWLHVIKAYLSVPQGVYPENEINEPIFLMIDRSKTSPGPQKIFVKPCDGSVHPIGVLTFPLARLKFKDGDRVVVGVGGTGKVMTNETLVHGDYITSNANGYAILRSDNNYSNFTVNSYHENFNIAMIKASYAVS